MPDHVHAMVIGQNADSQPKAMFERFKWLSGNWFRHHARNLSWQKDYYDHILRRGEDWAAQARYILCNPCRRGLAPDIVSWPYSGSIGCDLDDVMWDTFS